MEGLRRVLGLRRVEWARQVSSLNLLPTSSMLTLLDKKFGGELTKEDVQVSLRCCWLGQGVELPTLRSMGKSIALQSIDSKLVAALCIMDESLVL